MSIGYIIQLPFINIHKLMLLGLDMKLMNSIKTKIILLICGLSLGSFVIVSAIYIYLVGDISTKQANQYLANETKLLSLKFKKIFYDLSNDVSMVLYTPPIQGIIRSKANYDIDPISDSTLNQWRHRLENIFLSIMKQNKSYTQMRYIGIEDNGREIVRVNRDNQENLKIVPLQKLQRKGNESYFAEALKLKPEQVYFSNITYNRENGKVTELLEPTIRVIIPVYQNNDIFGMIIINANYFNLLSETIREINPSHNIFLVNNDKTYFQYNAKNKKYYLSIEEDISFPMSKYIKKSLNMTTNELVYADDNFYTHYVKETLNKSKYDNEQFFIIGLQIKNSELYAYTRSLQWTILLLLLFITGIKIVFGIIFSRKVTNPLIKITSEVEKYHPYKTTNLDLPIHNKDEIGLLSRAFKDMINQLQSRIEIDDLTGLYRRSAFFGHVESVIQSLARKDQLFGVGMIDVNNFKKINDAYGHETGDQILKVISTQLKSVFRESDKIARIGGDEFMIFCLLDSRDDKWFYRKVNQAISNANQIFKLDHEYSVSSGLSIFTSFQMHDIKNLKKEIHKADLLMYENKTVRKQQTWSI